MTTKHPPEKASASSAADFLKTVVPFSELDDEAFQKPADALTEKTFAKGTLIFTQGKTRIESLYLIKSGSVSLYLRDEKDIKRRNEYRGPGDYFGALGIITGTAANLSVEAVQETTCILIPKQTFQELIRTIPLFSHYYLHAFCERYIHPAHLELRAGPHTEDDKTPNIFSQSIDKLAKETVYSCLPTTTAQEAAAKMAERRIGSVFVQSEDGQLLGIVTDKDLRTKLVAQGLGCDTPVESIMSAPVKSISSGALCFDALFTMLKHHIHHLAVERNEKPFGVLTSHDIMTVQGDSPIFLFREIAAQTKIEGLYSIPKAFSAVVGRLMSQGVKASHLNRIITVLNDQILGRILDLLIMEIGPPPVAFCWLVMGSEGRKEQTFSTDQDNAIIFEDTGKEADDEAAGSYFLELAEKAVHHLAKCGYRLCKGDMMASNPSWTQSLPAWKRLFDHWIFSPDPKEVLYSTIFFDFRGGFGNVQLADELREHLMKRTSAEKVFIHHLARDCMDVRPPLSMFKQFKVEKEGPYKGQLDLKEKGLTPFVDFARLMCLDHGLPATNTLERFEALRKGAFISHDLAARIMEAYEFLMHVRLKEQLKEIKDGKEPDNFVMPSQLSDLDQRSLKKAFSLIGEAQSFIAAHFHLNLG